MGTFTKEISIRWSDLDPNFHVRHSAYYDFGAQHRIEILESKETWTIMLHTVNLFAIFQRFRNR